MFLEGQIVEFLDGDQLRPGYVRKQERERLQVMDPRGRQVAVNAERVVIVHRLVPESEYPAAVKGILERVQGRSAEVDIELLWESVGDSGAERSSSELAEMYFSESSPETASAVFHALSQDTLFFKRSGPRFLPKTAEQVSSERLRRDRQHEREVSREKLAVDVRRLAMARDSIAAPDLPDLLPVVDRIQNWMRSRTGDEVGTILEQIAGVDRARDTAYEILVRAGRIDPASDRFLVVAGIDERFSAEAVAAAAALLTLPHQEHRADLRGADTVTIDDEDTLEVDDALSIREEGDEWVVGIHIADLSPFVFSGDVLDSLARRRAATVYLPAVVARMLPERLSTDLASLSAGADRPAFTLEARFDKDFNRLGFRFVPATIHVSSRLSYTQADSRIEAGDSGLTILHRLAQRLQADRAARGAIVSRRPEWKVHVRRDESGTPHFHLDKIDPGAPSRVLVGEMMILYNSLAADFAVVNDIPVLFRTQEPRGPLPAESSPLPETLAFDRLRRTFKRSRLSLTPGQHAGLGLSAYTQASSPLRRYSDLVTQRQFAAFLNGKPLPHDREELLKVLASAESAEVEIRQLEERATTYWLLEYIAHERMDAVMNVVVLDNKSNVELEDLHLRGRLTEQGNAAPGSVVAVAVDHLDSLKAEVRFKRA